MTASDAGRLHTVSRRSGGPTVVIESVPGEPYVSVTTAHACGYRQDPPSAPGLAHLVEHLLCRGSAVTAGRPQAEVLADIGGLIVAATREDYTCFTAVCPAADLEECLGVQADRLVRPSFNIASVRHEVRLIEQETAPLRHQPETGFPWLQLAGPRAVFGDPAALAALDISDIRRRVETHYTAARSAVVISGDIDPHHTSHLVADHFSDFVGRAGSVRGDDWTWSNPVDSLAAPPPTAKCAALAWPVRGLQDLPERTAAAWLVVQTLISGPDPVLARIAATYRPGIRAFALLGLVGTSWEATKTTALSVGLIGSDRVPTATLEHILRSATRCATSPGIDRPTLETVAEKLVLSELANLDDPVLRARRLAVHGLFGGNIALMLDPGQLFERAMEQSVLASATERIAAPETVLVVAGDS